MFILILSCKKDEGIDRDQFIGTWKGTLNYSIPSYGTFIPRDLTITITSGSGSNNINISQAYVTTSLTAVVSGNTYTYNEYTITSTSGDGQTMVYNGQGSMSNNTLIENGTVVLKSGVNTYPGTWNTVLTKQK
jgi:archaellin